MAITQEDFDAIARMQRDFATSLLPMLERVIHAGVNRALHPEPPKLAGGVISTEGMEAEAASDWRTFQVAGVTDGAVIYVPENRERIVEMSIEGRTPSATDIEVAIGNVTPALLDRNTGSDDGGPDGQKWLVRVPPGEVRYKSFGKGFIITPARPLAFRTDNTLTVFINLGLAPVRMQPR